MSERVSFRDQVMAGDVPKGYEGLVIVPEPGVVLLNEHGAAPAKARDVTEERIALLMRQPA